MSATGRTVQKNEPVLRNGRILRNAFALLVSQVITWSLTLALTIFLPRYLGPASVGRLILANSIWSVAIVLITFGMDVHLTKEVARRPERLRELLGMSCALRAALFLVGLAGVLVYTRIAHYPADTVAMIWIVAAASFFALFSNACQAVLQGVERMEYMAAGSIAGKAAYSLGAIAMLVAGMDAYAVAAMAVAGALVTLVVQLRLVARLARPHVPPRLLDGIRAETSEVAEVSAAGSAGWNLRGAGAAGAWSEARHMLGASMPYLLSDAFLVLYMQADVVVLSLLLDERAVGWYGSAQQLFGTLLFVPSIVVTAIFPTLARLHANERGATAAAGPANADPATEAQRHEVTPAATGGGATHLLEQYMRRSFDLLVRLTIPVGLGIAVIANTLVVTLFGTGFANSGPILAVLGVVMILTSQNMLIGRFLVATDRQRQWVAAQALMGLATLGLDLVLVPWCQRTYGNGALGGALSYVVTESALLTVGMLLLPKGSLAVRNASVAVRSLAAGLAMVAVSVGLANSGWLRDPLSTGFGRLVPIAAGGVVYVMALWGLRAISTEELRYVASLMVSTVQTLRGSLRDGAVAARAWLRVRKPQAPAKAAAAKPAAAKPAAAKPAAAAGSAPTEVGAREV